MCHIHLAEDVTNFDTAYQPIGLLVFTWIALDTSFYSDMKVHCLPPQQQ